MTPVKAEAFVRGGAAGQVLGTDETSRYLTLLQAASLAGGSGFLQETRGRAAVRRNGRMSRLRGEQAAIGAQSPTAHGAQGWRCATE